MTQAARIVGLLAALVAAQAIAASTTQLLDRGLEAIQAAQR